MHAHACPLKDYDQRTHMRCYRTTGQCMRLVREAQGSWGMAGLHAGWLQLSCRGCRTSVWWPVVRGIQQH